MDPIKMLYLERDNEVRNDISELLEPLTDVGQFAGGGERLTKGMIAVFHQ